MHRITVIACATSALLASAVGAAVGTNPPARGTILSAFFGLDQSLRIAVVASRACRGYPGMDGMPVVFSHPIDAATLGPEDFEVTTASGTKGRVRCATLRPADEPGELRTVLLVGDLGSAKDQPVKVRIVGDLRSIGGGVSFRGATAPVIPLEAGPTLVLAEALARRDWPSGSAADCPSSGLAGIVRVTWAGGVTRPEGGEIEAAQMQKYRVTLATPTGGTVTVAPKTVGDLNDDDNHHELCLGVAGTPVSVFFPAGAVVDPNGDLNPDTRIAVQAPPSRGIGS